MAAGAESPGTPTAGRLNLDGRPRILGALFLVLGIICGLVAFYFPIHDALQGAAKVSYYPKAVFACVILTIIGLTFIILGPMAARLALKIAGLSGWKKWLVYAVLIIPLIGCGELVQYYFEQYLSGFGYKF